MKDALEFLFDKLADNWMKFVIAIGFTILGWFFGYLRARRNLSRREFYDRLNISLNSILNGKLQIRTLLEKRCAEVFLNSAATKMVVAAAQKTTSQDPILRFAGKEDWYFLNSVLNEVSEKFAAGALKQDLGVEVKRDTYLLCLTCESAANVRHKKVRAMLIKKALLENLPTEAPEISQQNHSIRWETLKKLAQTWMSEPDRFIQIELCQ